MKPLLSGHPARGLFFFSLPLMAGDLLQLFYSVADAFIVGRTLGISALAAVSCSFGLIAFVFGFSIGLTNGFAIIMAQRYGAGDGEGLRRSIALSIGLCLVFGAALTLVLAPLSRHILGLIYVGLTLFLLGIMLIFRSALQGLGKRISPTLCSIMEMAMSVVSAFLLIPHWGFIGICLANPLSWFASGIPLYIAFALFTRRRKAPGNPQSAG